VAEWNDTVTVQKVFHRSHGLQRLFCNLSLSERLNMLRIADGFYSFEVRRHFILMIVGRFPSSEYLRVELEICLKAINVNVFGL
jgi:hypothetical protein